MPDAAANKEDCEMCQECPELYHVLTGWGSVHHYTAKELDELALLNSVVPR